MSRKHDPGCLRLPIAQLMVILLTGSLALSCSFDYGAVQAATGEEQPSAIFSDFVHRVVDKGTLILEVKARRAEAFDKSHRTVMTDVEFSQFSSSGELAALGSADSATVYTDSENAEFRGRVRLESKTEDSKLEAEQLTWISDSKTLTGGLERIVSITRGDGAWVRGAGFEADMLHRSFSFQEASEGLLVTKDGGGGADAAGETGPAP